MIKSLFLFCILLNLFLLGCATTRAYQKELEAWKGRNQKQLIASWGHPNREEANKDGRKVFIYEKTDPKISYVRDTASSRTVRYFECVTRFFIDKDQSISGWTYEGPYCRK